MFTFYNKLFASQPKKTMIESYIEESIPKAFNVEELNKQLKKSLTTYSSFAEKEIFLLLGEPGSGKSTFANYMAGLPMEKTSDEKTGVSHIQIKQGFKPYTIIGHKVEAETIIPQLVPGAHDETYFYADCPPPKHNGHPDLALTANLLTQHAIRQSKNILGMIVLINDYILLKDNNNYIGFLLNYLPSFKKHQDSVLFIITKPLYPKMKPHQLCNRFLGPSKTSSDAALLFEAFAKDSSNIHIFNPLDENDRDDILSKIKKLKPIPKDHFVFPEFDKEQTELKKLIISIAEMAQSCRTKDPSGKNLLELFETSLVSNMYPIAKKAHLDSKVVDEFIALYKEHKTAHKKHKAIPEEADTHKKLRLS